MKCEVCQKNTKEFLIYEVIPRKIMLMDNTEVKKLAYCHEHLLQEFTRRVRDYDSNLVIFYPYLEDKTKHLAYAYLPFDKVREAKKDTQLLENALKSIQGNCARCGQPAQAAYFGDHSLKEGKNGHLIKWNDKFEKQIQGEAEIICRKCALDSILPSLKKFPEFKNGLCVPYHGDGMLFSL